MNRRSTSHALAMAVGALCALVVLTGCSGAGGEATASVRSTTVATPAPTVTVTATPAPVTPSPDDPIDAMGAWTACAVLGLAEYAGRTPGSELRPYDPAHPPTKNADGTFEAHAAFTFPEPVEGASSMVAICTIGGTLGHPTLVSWLLKDV